MRTGKQGFAVTRQAGPGTPGEIAGVVELEETLESFGAQIETAVQGKTYYDLQLDQGQPVAVDRTPTAEEQKGAARADAFTRLEDDKENPLARANEAKIADLILTVT